MGTIHAVQAPDQHPTPLLNKTHRQHVRNLTSRRQRLSSLSLHCTRANIAQRGDEPHGPAILTLIGSTGQGKSTAANDITGQKRFHISGSDQSCTTTITGIEMENGEMIVFDTLGLGDTSGRSEEFIVAITNHLHKYGGILVFVQSQSRMAVEVKKRLKALSLILGGCSFTNCCVLITTKYLPEDGHNEEQAARDLYEYQLALENEIPATFAHRYAYHRIVPDTKVAFAKDIRERVPKLKGLKPGEIQTWEQILELANGSVTDAAAQIDLLTKEVIRLESAIKVNKANLSYHEGWFYKILGSVGDMVSFLSSCRLGALAELLELTPGGSNRCGGLFL